MKTHFSRAFCPYVHQNIFLSNLVAKQKILTDEGYSHCLQKETGNY